MPFLVTNKKYDQLSLQIHHKTWAMLTIRVDYTDDIAALSDCMEDAQDLLCQLETAAAEVGLYINSKKTQCINFNQP